MPLKVPSFEFHKNHFMKRIILAAVLTIGFGLTSRANSFTIINMTGCTTSLEIRGVNPLTSLMFSSTAITALPGTVTFPVPSSIPGLSTMPGTVNFYYAKGGILSTSFGYAVGNLPAGMLPSASIPSTPCQQAGINIFFNGNSTGGNVVLLLM